MKSRKSKDKNKGSRSKRSPNTKSNKSDPLYLFYYSLFTEDPSNKMARNWLIDNGYMTRYNMSNLENELDQITSQSIKRRSSRRKSKKRLSSRSKKTKRSNKYKIYRSKRKTNRKNK